jgi:L-ascorbate metabolism protein UlaG (beta-lactamase superfamily)
MNARDDGRGSGRITWLGHASVLVDLDGVRVLTDPLLANRVAHLRRVVPRPADPVDLDAVLLSHLHRDHAHLPSLRRVARGRLVLAPAGSAALLARAGAAEVTEMAPGDRASVGALEVRAVHAQHDGRRGPGSPPAAALGYVVSGSRRVYFAGDTDLFPAMADLAPGLDVALLPIWGWGPTLGAGHLDPLRAAQALTMLRPRLAIPIHWGTYAPAVMWRAFRRSFLARPPHDFVRAARRLAPDVQVCVLAPGGSTSMEAA